MQEYRTRLLIIGAGPAGYTAAIYAARANLSPLLVCGMQPGGQLTVTTEVENYPGFADPIQGPWLMEQMRQQAENVGTQTVFDTIASVDFSQRPFRCAGEGGNTYIADSVIIATGAQAQWLGLESEKHFLGYGVSGCATCDGFFYRGKTVVVVGGGNTAVEEALYLTHHAAHVYLVHRRDTLRAEKILQDRLMAHPQITVLWNHVLDAVVGTDNPRSVTHARLQDITTGKIQDLAADGVFIAIGHKPATAPFEGQVEMDAQGYILCAPGTTQTRIPGVYAAGDVQDQIYRQAVTAAGQGCMAALDAERFLSAS